jgi:thiamine biosynthesis lipoprotein
MSIDADALSLVCFLMGLDEGLALIESTDDVEAVFVTGGGDIIASSGAPLE